MATVACPQCGLPRAVDQIGTMLCPLCHAAPLSSRQPRFDTKPAPPIVAGDLPADASELNKFDSSKQPTDFLKRSIVLLAFLAGVVVGVFGVLIWQFAISINVSSQQTKEPPVEHSSISSTLPLYVPKLEIAPMPRWPRVSDPDPHRVSRTSPEDNKKHLSLAPLGATVIHIDQSEATYAIPTNLKKGESVILRGRVKVLRVNALMMGVILDASELEVATIFVGGTVDGRSNLKLKASKGAVCIAARITGNSRVEIDASSGDIRFAQPAAASQPESQIDGGSTLVLSARSIDIRGDVNGPDTKIEAMLPPGGHLKLAAIRGNATVEYAVESGNGILPDVSVGTVAPTASFKRRN